MEPSADAALASSISEGISAIIMPPLAALTQLQFMELYPGDMDACTLADLSLRRMFCDFMASCLSIVLARSEDKVELQVFL